MSKPIAVIGSDIHYSLATLELADNATRQMIAKANELGVPLIIAGDLHDTKANMRAECVNAMIETFQKYNVEKYGDKLKPWVLVGNHDKVNEKSDDHALNFLDPYAYLVDACQEVCYLSEAGSIYLIPYQHDPAPLESYLSSLPKGSTVIMHQGVQGSNMGDYVQDKTAVPKEWCAGLRVISGHYHARQDIVCPDGGLFSYVGNPYTLSFGEANDPEKGYQTLYADGSLQHVETKLRKHRVIQTSVGPVDLRRASLPTPSVYDLVWVKLTGTKEELLKYDRQRVASELGLTGPFKLDFIPTDTTTEAPKAPSLNQNDLLDSMIDSLTNTTDERKSRLKSTWKDLL